MRCDDLCRYDALGVEQNIIWYCFDKRRERCDTCWSCQMQHQAFCSKFLTHQRLNSFLELHFQFLEVANCKIYNLLKNINIVSEYIDLFFNQFWTKFDLLNKKIQNTILEKCNLKAKLTLINATYFCHNPNSTKDGFYMKIT